eukprot:53104-Chlamydomonas_euryale.AAC.2
MNRGTDKGLSCASHGSIGGSCTLWAWSRSRSRYGPCDGHRHMHEHGRVRLTDIRKPRLSAQSTEAKKCFHGHSRGSQSQFSRSRLRSIIHRQRPRLYSVRGVAHDSQLSTRSHPTPTIITLSTHLTPACGCGARTAQMPSAPLLPTLL